MPAVPIIAAVTGAAGAIGAAASTAIGLGTVSALTATAIGTGIVAGGMTAIQGGDVSDVLESAVVGGVTSFVGGTVAGAVGNTVAEATGSNIFGDAIGNASRALVTGGDTRDILTSGLIGGIGAGIGQLEQDLRQEEFDTAITESGLAGQTLMDDGLQTVLQEYEQVPSIGQLIEELQPYQQPYIPDDNEVLMPEYIQPPTVDNSDVLTILGVAKNFAPMAINAITANSATSIPEEITGFGIIPVPKDWQSPTYNQEFIQSAPLDFGSLELLQGTQFERPNVQPRQMNYSLSDVINTLNYQSVPFVPQQYEMPKQVSTSDFISKFQTPTVGTNELIGNLGGKPVSIADIISGIQSQYG